MKFKKNLLKNRKEWIEICANSEPSQEMEDLFNNNKLLPCEIKFIAYSQKYKLQNLTERFNIYKNLTTSQKKGNSLQTYYLKYGKEVGRELYFQKNEVCKQTLQNFINRHGNTEGEKKYKEHTSKKRETLENFIRRYGLEKGTNKYNSFCKKNEGNCSLQRQIEIHGKDLGLKKFEQHKNKLKHLNSLDGYVERFGKEIGEKKFIQRMQKMHRAQRKNIRGCSKKSQKLFLEIYRVIQNKYAEIYFDQINREFSVENYLLDFFVKDTNKCIEFNGDKFHANPEIYKAEDCPHPYLKDLKSQDIWIYDEKRVEKIKGYGIKVLVIWEKELREAPTSTIKKCLEFLYE